MQSSQQKWDKRYSDRQGPGKSAAVLLENQHLLSGAGTSLDLACGLGANAMLLAQLGYESHAWDISSVALEKLQQFARTRNLRVLTEQRDIVERPPAALTFDLICCTHFLHRPLCNELTAALKPGGIICYQTFTQARLPGRETPGPSDPEFLLRRNELLTLFGDLIVVAYREDIATGVATESLQNQAWLLAAKHD